jgi:ubiquinol-cytochrome c reductase iron-sulfur subunit
MRRLGRWFIALLVLARALRTPVHEHEAAPRERIIPPGAPSPRAELVVAGLLLACGAASALSVVGYWLDWTIQAFGGALAAALGFFAAALIVGAETLIVTEHLEEEYPPEEHPDEEADLAALVRESGDRITRKRLLGGAAGVAGTAMGAALLAPVVSMGPVFDTSRLNDSPWRRGRALVDEHGKPLSADEIEEGPFYTAFPEGAERKDIASPLILIKLPTRILRLPPGRQGWAPEGILAYSKICTHAGCAIALYRTPKFAPVEPKPALVCPCHYSTFDPAAGGEVLFGPAGRSLPQLPLLVDDSGFLRAGGNFSGAVGPSWWGVRSREPNP